MATRSRFSPTELAPALLLAPAAFLVHQLRYWLAFGGQAGVWLERQGHAYLSSLVPWLATVIALVFGLFLRALARALAGRCTPARFALSLTALWAACTAALVAIYCSQELLEGALAPGHPAGLAGVFGQGGLWALPASAAVGLVLASLLHGARFAVHRAHSVRLRAPRPAAVAPTLALAPVAALRMHSAPVIDGCRARGPPR